MKNVINQEEIKSDSDILFEKQSTSIKEYIYAISSIILICLICYTFLPLIGYQAVSLILLFTVSFLPLFLNAAPVMLAACLSALLWNYFFIPPKFTFYINTLQDILLFFGYFIISMITSILTSRINAQEKITRIREARTHSLYNLTRELSIAGSFEGVINVSVNNINKIFKCEVAIFVSDEKEKLSAINQLDKSIKLSNKEYSIANWTFENKEKSGKFTTTLSSIESKYYPLLTPRGIIGVISIKRDLDYSQDQEKLFETFLYQIASAIERELLNENAKRAMLIFESEKLYSNIFNSISHELRTPIATIMGASENLLDKNTSEIKELRDELIEEVYIAAERLNHLVGNLLDMSRLESGMLQLNLDWHDINDLFYHVTNILKKELKGHKLKILVEDNIPLLKIDFVLIEQVLVNILINSSLYTQPDSEIILKCEKEKDNILISVSDNGSGLSEELIENIFEKFYRVPGTKTGGTGLGLSIAKGFVEAHKGKIFVKNNESAGLTFFIRLPLLDTKEIYLA